MVLDPADRQRGTAQALCDACQIRMDLLSERSVTKQGPSLLCGEHGVDIESGIRLRHLGAMLLESVRPSGSMRCAAPPGVSARASTPWLFHTTLRVAGAESAQGSRQGLPARDPLLHHRQPLRG